MDAFAGSVKVLLAAAAVGLTIFTLSVRNRAHPPGRAGLSKAVSALLHHGRRKLLSSLLDVGGFFSADIGGSLTKLVFFLPDAELIDRLLQRVPPEHIASAHWQAKLASIADLASFVLAKAQYGRTGVRDAHLSFHISELGGTFHFIRFETRRMDGAIALAKLHGLHTGMNTICATGGGAHRFAKAFKEELGVQVEPRDEIDCLVKGLAFFMGYVESEAYTFHGRWERVSGTSLGGGTFYGLCHMLTSLTSFDQMLDLAEDGNNVHVDLTVGDIYGGDYNKFGLKSTTIASSFGKAMMWNFPDRRTQEEAEKQAQKREGSRSLDAGKDLLEAAQLPDKEHTLSQASYEASATAALRKVTLDAGSFGSDVIGGKGPSRSEAAQLHCGPIYRPGDSIAERPPKITITAAQQLIASHPGAGFATPLQPRASGSDPVFDGNSNRPPSEDAPAGKHISEDGDRAASGHSPRFRSASEGLNASGSSSFASEEDQGKYQSKDVARALLIMISNNIGQLGYLNAVRYNCKHVYFAGNFLRHENTIAMRTLSYAITFWSQGTMEALFLRHEGYCGAVGAFLSTLQTAEELPEEQ